MYFTKPWNLIIFAINIVRIMAKIMLSKTAKENKFLSAHQSRQWWVVNKINSDELAGSEVRNVAWHLE